MYRRWIGLLLLGVFVVGVVVAQRSDADVEKPAKLPGDLDFVFETGQGFVTIRPRDLLDAGPIKQLPAQIKSDLQRDIARAQAALGMTADDMERVTILLPSSPVGAPSAVVRTVKPIDRDTLIKKTLGDEFREEKYKGRSLGTQRGGRGSCLCVLDDQSFLIGNARGVKLAIDGADGRSTPRPHGQAVEWAAAKHQVVLGLTAEPVFWYLSAQMVNRGAVDDAPTRTRIIENEAVKDRGPVEKQLPPRPPQKDDKREKQSRSGELREEYYVVQREVRIEDVGGEPDFADIIAQLPVPALPFKPLLTAKSLAAAIDLGDELKIQLRIAFENEDAARDGEVALRVALYVLREAIGQLPRQMHLDADAAPKVTALVRNAQAALRATTIQRRGTAVEGGLVLKTDDAALKPLFAEMERAKSRMQAMNNLRQIGIAMHNYHGSYGTFPGMAICDPTGKPLLSWRVAILPFIEQENLYRQFKLDEPWDSAHNIKLLDRMPAIYAMPGRDAKKGETFFRVFTGPNGVFNRDGRSPGVGPTIVMFADGTSNTLLVVETTDGVAWTKPDEPTADAKKPLPKLGGRSDGFFACFADGSVHLIPKKIDEQTLRYLIDPADGMIIDWEQIEPRRGQPNRPRSVDAPPSIERPKDEPRPERKQ